MNAGKHDKAIQSIVDFLNGDACLFKENKKKRLQSIKDFRQSVIEVGLSGKQLFTVGEIAASQKLDETLSTQLIVSLLPRESVPEDVALMLISKVCSNVQSYKVKHFLFRWLVLVFDLLTSKQKLRGLYGILFRYLEVELLRPTVCHLLYLLTTKPDVTHYRISKLLEIQKKYGSHAHLCGLLSLYRMYQPALISMSGGYRTFFTIDKAWEKAIYQVQQRYGLHMVSETLHKSRAGTVLPLKRKQAPLVSQPEYSTVHDPSVNQPPISGIISGKVPVYRIHSFQELLDNFSQLDLSSQAFTLLSSVTLQHAITVTSDRTVAVRLCFWLHHWLNRELISSPGESARGRELVNVLLQFAGLTQECSPVCEAFLCRYLCTWNGQDYQNAILNLIAKLRIMRFSDLQQFILTPLQKLCAFTPSHYFTSSVLHTLSELLRNYLTIESRRYEKMRTEGAVNALEQIRFSVYTNFVGEIDIDSTISGLVQFADSLYVSSARTTEKKLFLLHHILRFHLQVSTIYLSHGRPLLVLPDVQIVFDSVFSLSAPCVTNMMEILRNHRRAVCELMKEKIEPSQKNIDLLNRYLTDIHDMLWRRRSFHPHCSDTTLLFPDLDSPKDLMFHPDELPPRRMFSLDRHPALVVYAEDYIQVMGEDFDATGRAEFVHDESFMDFLESKGLRGLVALIKDVHSSS